MTTMYCLATVNLTHKFSEKANVLDNINLHVPENSIYGFLGPNGAGKTTTLRLVLGLLKKQKGAISVFGKPFDDNRVDILRRVGSLIETPSLYSHLTAIENLGVWQKIYQCPKERFGKVLDFVGLPDTGNKKSGRFSLGMKQRLSIAIAMLNDPALLILDEPTNGLDPNGIIEIRELLRRINKEQGITIIISSHLLSEVERLATHVGIINKGKMMFQGTLEELISKQRQESIVILETDDPAKTLRIATGNNLAAHVENGRVSMPFISNELIAEVNRQLVQSGVKVHQIAKIKNDLETIFIDLINN